MIALVIDTFKAYTDSKKMPEQYSTETEPASYGRSSGELADSIAQEGGLHAIPTSLIPSDSPTPKFSHQVRDIINLAIWRVYFIFCERRKSDALRLRIPRGVL